MRYIVFMGSSADVSPLYLKLKQNEIFSTSPENSEVHILAKRSKAVVVVHHVPCALLIHSFLWCRPDLASLKAITQNPFRVVPIHLVICRQ